MSGLFDSITFLIIDSPKNGEYSISWMREVISLNGGRSIILTPDLSSEVIQNDNISHIITSTFEFSAYRQAQDLMVPVTSPQWLEDSELASQRKNYRLYSPQPVPFMDKVVVCIADNLPEGDKEMMYAGVRAFGGQYLDSLSRYTTHLIAMDLTNNKSVLAANIRQRENLQIQIVLPHWLDDCFRMQKRLEEKPYRLSDPVALRTSKPNFEISNTVADSIFDDENSYAISSDIDSDFLHGKRVYIAPDHCFSEHFKDSIFELVELYGGRVVRDYDFGALDVYIGKYRKGSEYTECLHSSTIEVGSLRWLYQMAIRKEYVLPLKSNVLNFPLPCGAIPELSGARISITGYSGDARHYLSLLISAMGALFTKTLDCNNDYLVAEKDRGEKYMAVKSRWPEVKIVNHLWIEQCFAQWKFIKPTISRYHMITQETAKLGSTVIDPSLLGPIGKDFSLNVDDSAAEDLDADISVTRQEEEQQQGVNEEEILVEDLNNDPLNDSPDASQFIGVKGKPSSQGISSDLVLQIEDINSPAPTRFNRSAKQRATTKLHSDMEDLNTYTSILKSTRKMNSYMKQLETSISTPQKREAGGVAPSVTEGEKSHMPNPSTKKRKPNESVQQVVLLTGCEAEISLSRADVIKLAKIGIKVVNDYNSKLKVDSIIAPRVLRTEKFLKCLSQCSEVLHPRYLSDILSEIQLNPDIERSDIFASFQSEHYSLDSILLVKRINEDLGVTLNKSGLKTLLQASNKGAVFKNIKVNLSQNLNGGPDLIASILKEHGLEELRVVKLSANFNEKSLLENSDGRIILVAHKDKDRKAFGKLSSEGIFVVEWDWCVKSIFKLNLDSFSPYVIN